MPQPSAPNTVITSVPEALIVTNFYPLFHTVLMSTLSFCASVRVHHIFCELYEFLKLSCSDIRFIELVVYTMRSFLFVIPFVCISASCMQNFSAILRLWSSQDKLKAFSTCSPQPAVVSLFYRTLFGVSLLPSSSYTAKEGFSSHGVVCGGTTHVQPFHLQSEEQGHERGLRSLLSWRRLLSQ